MFSSLRAVSTRVVNQRFFSTKTGTVKWFDVKRGFGFIIPDDGSEEVFVHQTAIHAEGFRSLGEGEPVEFTTTQDDASQKIKAERVTGPMGAYVQGAPRRPFRDFASGDSYGYPRRQPGMNSSPYGSDRYGSYTPRNDEEGHGKY